MAAYGTLIQSIHTSEINRVNREGSYTRWCYFVDMEAGKAGILCVNDTQFAAFTAEEEPDPKLHAFGLEAIKELILTPDPQLLVLTAGSNQLQATLFSDPLMIIDDDFAPALTPQVAGNLALDWQRFLVRQGVQREAEAVGNRMGLKVAIVGGLLAAAAAIAAFMLR